ncbi:CPK3, partial [Symbiodinium sp. CCMP2592]
EYASYGLVPPVEREACLEHPVETAVRCTLDVALGLLPHLFASAHPSGMLLCSATIDPTLVVGGVTVLGLAITLTKDEILHLFRRHGVDLQSFFAGLFAGRQSFAEAYRVLGKIGEGGYGVIHRVRHRQTSRVFAVKEIPATMKAELQILRDLQHTHVAKLHGAWEEGMCIYLVMDLYQQDLSWMLRAGAVPEERALCIFEQLMTAVAFIHMKGVCHRDIKLANVMVQSTQDLHVRLLDFGAAAYYNKRQLTTTVFTAQFVAPEMLAGAYDHRIDMWSSGVLLFWLLSGWPPFSGDNCQILRSVKIAKWQFEPVAAWQGISGVGRSLVASLMVKEVETRIGAAEVLQQMAERC